MNRYILFAITLVALVCTSYVLNFYFRLEYVISDKPEAWGQLGDFIGGLINPIFGFMSFVFIIKSLNLQNKANLELREEMKNTRKTEKLRSFETQLFHMIGAQRASFDLFKVSEVVGHKVSQKFGVEAVISIETEVERLRSAFDEEVIVGYLETIDPTDQMYGLTRMFYNMVKMISEQLNDSVGFNLEDRRSHYLTLINFTDFSLLRLIMMNSQFVECPPTVYLRNNSEFSAVLYEVELNYSLY
ncbi:hypothetical protein [Pseudomonas capsici]|uniref:hypothetical protein n=1 Tax=Pseudomonas capsici TaxID=2810614 RepID=UPI0021F1C32E|nr:hypothetical protein [Pseudomonas capsici]MCV4264494.1 hypothetical protein [Pseudomonas capsici]